MAKKTLEEQIESFLELWTMDHQVAFLKDIMPLFELFFVEGEEDWVEIKVGKENMVNVRLIRTVYIMSRIADQYTGRLAQVKANFPDLYRQMEALKG